MTFINQEYYILLSQDDKLEEKKEKKAWENKVKDQKLTLEDLGIPGLSTSVRKAKQHIEKLDLQQ